MAPASCLRPVNKGSFLDRMGVGGSEDPSSTRMFPKICLTGLSLCFGHATQSRKVTCTFTALSLSLSLSSRGMSPTDL